MHLNRFTYIPIFTVLIFTLSIFSIPDAHAVSRTFTTNTILTTSQTIGTGETWTVNSGVTLTINSGVTITNNGTIANGNTFNNNLGGTINNTGTITNFGTIQNFQSSHITNKLGGKINNNSVGTINSFTNGVILNYGIIINSGSFPSSGYITNIGTFTNSGTFQNSIDGNMNNDPGGKINNDPGGTMTNYGTINNYAAINNKSSIANYATISNLGGTISNYNTILNSGGIITNAGTIYNYSGGLISSTLFGTINNNSDGVINNNRGSVIINTGGNIVNSGSAINNSGIINSQGAINNYGNSVIANFGIILSSGNMTINGGNIENKVGALFENSGTIDLYGNLTNSYNIATHFGGDIHNYRGGKINIGNTGIITNSIIIWNEGTITINPGGVIVNNVAADIINHGSLINNSGTINNSAQITNYGIIMNNQKGYILNSNFIIDQCGSSYTGTLPSGNPIIYVICQIKPTIQMNDTTISSDSLISSSRPFIGEYASPTSVLVGKKIDSISLRMGKVGSPTGTAQVGIFDINRNVVKLFATVDVSTISNTDTVYEFKLPSTDSLYTIASGDRIGFKYTGGSSSVGVNVTPDRVAGDPFDGTNSYRVRYETAWITSSSEDMYMILQAYGDTGQTPTSITLDPTSGPVGTIVTVTGINFTASSTVAIIYNGSAVVTTPTPLTTTASGGFSATFTVPSSEVSGHTVRASSGGSSAQATFTVTGSTLHSTTTSITPNPSQVAPSSTIPYTATITDNSGTPTAPTGSVTFSDGGKGGSFTACTLVAGTGKSTCSTTYTSPSAAGPETINGTYPGDTTHQKSSGISALTVGTSTFPIIVMSDTTVSFDSLISSSRPFIGEYASPTSALVGKQIDSITLRMAKVGAPTGTAQVGIFDINRNIVKLFATVDVSTISTTDTVYEFKLAPTDHYIIKSGDRIGFAYTGGSSTVGVNVTPDRVTTDPFDGANSYRVRYETAWITSSSEDMYMILKQTHG